MRILKKEIAVNVLILVVVAFTVYPVIMMFFGSFKSAGELSANPAGIPLNPTIVNYINLFKYNGGTIAVTFFNSVFVTVSYVAVMLFLSSLAAFAFAKYKFKGRNVIFAALLATMMVPVELLIPPLYVIFAKIGWLNTYKVQIFPEAARVFSLFLLRQYMLSIPDSLIEAAKIDGAGHLKVYWRIIIPTSVPALATVAIMQFMHKWNDYLWPFIMVNKPTKLPIMVILPTIREDGNLFSIPWELVLTGCVVATVPILLFFLIFHDKIMSSVTAGAVKG